MPRKVLAPEIWDEIGHHWRIGHLTVVDIARRYGLNNSSIYAKARRNHWPPRQTPRDNPQAAREALLADLTFSLRQSLAALRTLPPADTPATARDRTRLIREYQRSLAALVLKTATAQTAPATATDVPALELEAAKREVLDRLARLDRTATETPDLDDTAPRPAVDPPGSP